MLEQTLADIHVPKSLDSLTSDIAMPSMPDISLNAEVKEKSEIFSIDKRKSWDKSVEARCDFQYKLRLTRRASTNFISIWQKSVFGRTLTDIKSDDAMISYFVENISKLIRECMSDNLSDGSWAIVATPMRRHKEHNFASLIAEGIAESLGIPFYFDCAHCHSKQRVGAVFSANNIPHEPNVIVFDDFVTTGSTLLAMKSLLQEHGKNTVFFCGINNKL